jgi:hypothetical protein
MKRNNKWEKVGVIGVDAGLCWIGDPCYCVTPDADNHPAKNWKEFCRKLDLTNPNTLTKQWNYKAGHPGLGVSVSTGYGDGEYNVYVKKTNEGRISEVKVVFI